MKKLFVLTSIFALAACGGGGGGGGGGVAPISAPVVPDILGGAVSAAAQASNNNVTKMKGEVIVASNWNAPLTRHSSTDVGGVTFHSYQLDDVYFFLADDVNTEQGYLKIGKNEETGRIENIELHAGGAGAPVARVGDGHQFRGPIFEYVEDSYAKVGSTDFVVENDTDAILSAIANKMGFDTSVEGSGWKLLTGVWKFDTDGENHFATYNPGSGTVEYSVGTSTELMESALKKVYGFGDGKWVVVGDNLKYIEYGDEAVFRTVETTTMNADTLANLESEHSLSGGHWNRVDETMDVVTLGGDIDGAGTALQYADFGHFNPVYKTKDIDIDGGEYGAWTNVGENKSHTDEEVADELAAEDYQLFAGGYAIKGVNWAWTLDPEANTSYTGKAIGRVYTSIQGNNNAVRESHFAANGITSGDGHDIAKAFTTNAATMTIGADGKQTLFMPFYSSPAEGSGYYYDVRIVKNGNSVEDPVFTSGIYTDTGATSAGNPIASEYRLYNAMAHVVPGQSSFSPGYYGVNTPSEAAGTARSYSEENFGDGAKRVYELQAAWGMKKD